MPLQEEIKREEKWRKKEKRKDFSVEMCEKLAWAWEQYKNALKVGNKKAISVWQTRIGGYLERIERELKE